MTFLVFHNFSYKYKVIVPFGEKFENKRKKKSIQISTYKPKHYCIRLMSPEVSCTLQAAGNSPGLPLTRWQAPSSVRPGRCWHASSAPGSQ